MWVWYANSQIVSVVEYTATVLKKIQLTYLCNSLNEAVVSVDSFVRALQTFETRVSQDLQRDFEPEHNVI